MKTYTVRKLIEELQKEDPDKPVILIDLSNDDEDGDGQYSEFSIGDDEGVDTSDGSPIALVSIAFNKPL